MTLTSQDIENFKDLLSIEMGFINEREACELLNITKRTLCNYISSGRIPTNYYSVGVGGNKFFDKKKLMGLK
jgi:hypothetical protein